MTGRKKERQNRELEKGSELQYYLEFNWNLSSPLLSSPLLVGSSNCTCPPGKEGPECKNDTDNCASNPCVHGATCHDGLNSYICDCPKGFVGKRCEANVLECLSGPCQNNGTCVENVGAIGYTCRCSQAFRGQYVISAPYKMAIWSTPCKLSI